MNPQLKRLLFGLAAACVLGTASSTSAQNLVVNPGFEDGPHNDAPPWGVGGWRGTLRATTQESHGGRRSLLMEGGGDEGGINSAVQVIPIDPTGQTKYHFKIWVKIPSASAGEAKNARTRWMFSEGTGAGFITPVTSPDWVQVDEGDQELVPPAGAQHIIYRMYGLTGRYAMYIDDAELVGEPTGNPSYPGITGTVKDSSGNPVAGALVFLNSNTKAQEFANVSAVTDSTGKFTACVAEEGAYFAVAWKAGYNLTSETAVNLTAGTLTPFNPTLAKGTGGRNLAIATDAKPNAVKATPDGFIDDPQFQPDYVFDGNSLSTRYYNAAGAEPNPKDRWIYVDLDPVGKKTYPIRGFVMTWLGISQNAVGWPGLGDVAAKDFAIEYTTGDPATESNWSSKVAYSTSGAPTTFAPVVVRLDSPVTARAIRFHVTEPAGGGFGPTEVEVLSDTLGRSTLSGVVKDATTGSPVAGARVVTWTPIKIQSDPDIYGSGTKPPFIIYEEYLKGTPYDIPVSKNIEQTVITDAQGRYSFDVHPGRDLRVSALISGYAYATASVTPPEDGAAITQDIPVAKSVVLSGVIRNASGPLHNAIVQVGPAGSSYVTVTGADGKYSFAVGAGTHELYADAAGYAANTQSVTLTADTSKDVVLTATPEPNSINDTFDSGIAGWEIAKYDTNWVAIGAATAAVRDNTQNSNPGGSGSAVIEDTVIVAADGVTEPLAGYHMMQRTAAQRVAVESGKAYNVHFRVKAENWVSPEHRDAVHYQIVWRNAAGTVISRIDSHPYWIYAQPFWYTCDRGHPEGTADSITLARIAPPAGAASLDLRVGWVRNDSQINPDTETAANPAGSLLYVDDLVIDSVGAASGAPTLAVARDGAGLKLTFDGVLESASAVTGSWTPVAGATSPLVVTPSAPQVFYRTRR